MIARPWGLYRLHLNKGRKCEARCDVQVGLNRARSSSPACGTGQGPEHKQAFETTDPFGHKRMHLLMIVETSPTDFQSLQS